MRVLSFLLFVSFALAEDGLQAWLRYASQDSQKPILPSSLILLNGTNNGPIETAGKELQAGLHSMFGAQIENCQTGTTSSAIVVGTWEHYRSTYPDSTLSIDLIEDGFWLSVHGADVRIVGQNERGALFGTFEYLSMLAQGNFSDVEYATNPAAPIRWTNEWDNMDASGTHGIIERGFAGNSIFFEDGKIKANLTRAAEYARLLASIRINAVVVNNVNANYTTLQPENIEGLGRIADVFRPYGVQLGLSLYFASPANLTDLDTYDPLDGKVIDFWTNKTNEIYERIPDMAGYLVKANSEGQPGPLQYNRTLAEGANLFARALQPHGGVLMFRAFVYDQINETDWKADRANAAVDYFKPLDGRFEENVVVQIKYGPIDFQVREPVSPLFANLQNTSMAIELQVTQEYLGQQVHLVYLPPLWKTLTDFDLRINNSSSLLRDVMTGYHHKRPLGGSAAVVNVGTNTTWLGSHLAMSNLYAYGRLAWDWTLDSEDILQDWIRLTFGHNERVIETITEMAMASWPAYENYTGNLGTQTLTDIIYTHFGPYPQSQDNNGYGQWTRADPNGIGMDRTVSNGTGYAGQYPSEVAQMYEEIATTPDDLLLWFHHVPYTQVLKSGKSIAQHFYDAHYTGASTANNFVHLWQSLKGLIDDERYQDVLYRQEFQAGHSIVWRDAINNWIYNLSSIEDEADRVGHHPWRIEAEDMQLEGYQKYTVAPYEVASGAMAIITSSNTTSGTASTTVPFEDGTYDLVIQYFDLTAGNSTYSVTLDNCEIGRWISDDVDTGKLGHTPSIYLDGHSSSRKRFAGVEVKKGDVLKIVGVPGGIEPAPVDYVAFLPEGVVD
ncbi:Putative alpha glucuronidase, glycosyl hydrolase family 67, glycoside hydrolase superfamily [Septoria linicola]|uniref:Alpha-glucuronidase n=1 Tax=Septoria linicola TaxID=215465 RepID=A0A9Q9AQI3_9PEZI|nr:putative alpha glucuronidase, glycosyl hydrolase family 67, glycoside hydrolase superfamily [Septoria linicola]USW50725.1 Putative alpha glucuronidase, glycosyl hydrolase family 67, glycoside hydrolase superfamily [Septoria linicola]